jgi:hypothetical protein
MRVTLDTNVVRDMLDSRRTGHQDAVRLAALIRDAKIKAQLTTRINVDVPAEPLKSMIAGLPDISGERAGAPFRLDYSRLDSGDYIPSDFESEEASTLMRLLFPGAEADSPRQQNRLADVDHLLAHRRSGADWFLTSEKSMLENEETLRDQYSICVCTPKAFLDRGLCKTDGQGDP